VVCKQQWWRNAPRRPEKAKRLGLKTVPLATLKGLQPLRRFLKDHGIQVLNAHTGSTHSLAVASALVLLLTSNALAAVLALLAIAFYAVGYTMLLKRRTPQNIVWGGAAGCMPVLIAWAAVTGSLSWTPVVLFLIIFFWTPPHYWPLAMRFRDDYAAAGVPMLPVVRTDAQVANSIVAYTWVMVAMSLLLVPVAPMGWVYGVGAAVLPTWVVQGTDGTIVVRDLAIEVHRGRRAVARRRGGGAGRGRAASGGLTCRR